MTSSQFRKLLLAAGGFLLGNILGILFQYFFLGQQ